MIAGIEAAFACAAPHWVPALRACLRRWIPTALALCFMGCRSPQREMNADVPPQAPRLSERPDPRPMGRDRPDDPGGSPGRPSAPRAEARDRRGDPASAARGPVMAASAASLPTLADGLSPSAPLGARRGLDEGLVMADRERAGREASPSAAIIDSQTVRTADRKGGSKATTPQRRSMGASATS
jgi:hypothetical protein